MDTTGRECAATTKATHALGGHATRSILSALALSAAVAAATAAATAAHAGPARRSALVGVGHTIQPSYCWKERGAYLCTAPNAVPASSGRVAQPAFTARIMARMVWVPEGTAVPHIDGGKPTGGSGNSAPHIDGGKVPGGNNR